MFMVVPFREKAARIMPRATVRGQEARCGIEEAGFGWPQAHDFRVQVSGFAATCSARSCVQAVRGDTQIAHLYNCAIKGRRHQV
jgi:hypothetical protein